ncbi:MAG: hypothetical protein EOO26_09390 [Comamonadaceae bacterium]|nr:MAG: hypothetical protein EOO26_09390 [Comamonadaceae bacterium]
MNVRSTFESLKNADGQRADFPGEHVAVLAAGLLLLMAAGRGRSFLMRTLLGTAGTALVGRAASGTGGVAKLASVLGGRHKARAGRAAN